MQTGRKPEHMTSDRHMAPYPVKVLPGEVTRAGHPCHPPLLYEHFFRSTPVPPTEIGPIDLIFYGNSPIFQRMCRYSTKCRCHRTLQNAHRLNPYGKGNGPCPKCGKSKTNEATQCMACKWAEGRKRKLERLRTAPPSHLVPCSCGGQKSIQARECTNCRSERIMNERAACICQVCVDKIGIKKNR